MALRAFWHSTVDVVQGYVVQVHSRCGTGLCGTSTQSMWCRAMWYKYTVDVVQGYVVQVHSRCGTGLCGTSTQSMWYKGSYRCSPCPSWLVSLLYDTNVTWCTARQRELQRVVVINRLWSSYKLGWMLSLRMLFTGCQWQRRWHPVRCHGAQTVQVTTISISSLQWWWWWWWWWDGVWSDVSLWW